MCRYRSPMIGFIEVDSNLFVRSFYFIEVNGDSNQLMRNFYAPSTALIRYLLHLVGDLDQAQNYLLIIIILLWFSCFLIAASLDFILSLLICSSNIGERGVLI